MAVGIEIMGITDPSKEHYAATLKDHGYRITFGYSDDDILGKFPVPEERNLQLFDAITLEAQLVLETLEANPSFITVLRERTPESKAFGQDSILPPTPIIVFFTHEDLEKAEELFDTVDGVVHCPTRSGDILVQVDSLKCLVR